MILLVFFVEFPR